MRLILICLLAMICIANPHALQKAFGFQTVPLPLSLPPSGPSGIIIDGLGTAGVTINAIDPATPASTLVGAACSSFIAYDQINLYTCGGIDVGSVYVATPLPVLTSIMAAMSAKPIPLVRSQSKFDALPSMLPRREPKSPDADWKK